jgi:hypothetical protein
MPQPRQSDAVPIGWSEAVPGHPRAPSKRIKVEVTTESQGSQTGLARAAGVTDFAVKPLTPAGLAERVRDLLR